jgi:hypothetical protein
MVLDGPRLSNHQPPSTIHQPQELLMQIRDRIKELRRVRAAELTPNPRNWRTHPQRQRNALRGVLAEIGYAGALLARELDDGGLELIDGHLRARATPDARVPVLVLDVDEAEADKLLLTHDPLGEMAGRDRDKLDALLRRVDTGRAAVRDMLAGMADRAGLYRTGESAALRRELPESFQVLVECGGEEGQRELFERLIEEGYSCRVLTL